MSYSVSNSHLRNTWTIIIMVNCAMIIGYALHTLGKFNAGTLRLRPVSPRHREKPPLILFWTKFFKRSDWYVGVGEVKHLRNCNVTCEITADKSRFNESKAIIIHPRNTVKRLPSNRRPWQHLYFFLKETPINTPNLKRFANVFNYTITYRRDSDIPAPYGYIKRRATPPTNLPVRSFERRNGVAVWVVSNCQPQSKRHKFVRHLQRYLPVKVFGACVKRRCNKACFEKLKRTFKFYLSFENCLCSDYVTEKLYRTLEWGLIPIVLGGANYTELLPRNSYISIADFNSPKDLARYVLKVSKNETLYNTFFDWRRHYDIGYVTCETIFCKLCRHIQGDGDLKPKIYKDLDRWWSKNQCRSPEKQFPHLAKYF